MKNMFETKDVEAVIVRINNLSPQSTAQWGIMSVDQMLAHCNVTYEFVYDNIHKKPGVFKRMILKALVKKFVVNEVPYKQNGRTAPEFKMTERKDFEIEKFRLIRYLEQTLKLGAFHFDKKESHSFGALTEKEWSNMFYKHLDHHLRQFGV